MLSHQESAKLGEVNHFAESDPREESEFFRDHFRALQSRVAEVVLGQEEVVLETLIALVAGGHVLLEGVPGLGKTLLVKTVAKALDLEFQRVQFTPDLLPADLLGTMMLVQEDGGSHSLRFEPGPIFCNVLLGDEINRATPKTQSALLEAMQEMHVTIAGESRALKSPFFVLATQNPLEMEGTYPLPEAQLDRFLFQVLVSYPSAEDLDRILCQQRSEAKHADIRPVADANDLARMHNFCASIPAGESVRKFLIHLVLSTNPQSSEAPEIVKQYVRCGASPRAALACMAAARVVAAREGRFHVAKEDIVRVLLPALRHRLLLRYDAKADGVSADEILRQLLRHAEKRSASA